MIRKPPLTQGIATHMTPINECNCCSPQETGLSTFLFQALKLLVMLQWREFRFVPYCGLLLSFVLALILRFLWGCLHAGKECPASPFVLHVQCLHHLHSYCSIVQVKDAYLISLQGVSICLRDTSKNTSCMLKSLCCSITLSMVFADTATIIQLCMIILTNSETSFLFLSSNQRQSTLLIKGIQGLVFSRCILSVPLNHCHYRYVVSRLYGRLNRALATLCHLLL